MPLVVPLLGAGERVVLMLPALLARRMAPAVWGRLPPDPGEDTSFLLPELRVGVADWPRCWRACILGALSVLRSLLDGDGAAD